MKAEPTLRTLSRLYPERAARFENAHLAGDHAAAAASYDELTQMGLLYREIEARGRLSVVIGSSMDGCDRWMICRGNTIVRAWSMPRWLSFRRFTG